MTGWRLLLTRPADESVALARVLANAGVFSSSLPLLDIEPIPASDTMREVIQNLDSYSAVIVVSKPAARIAVPPQANSSSIPLSCGNTRSRHGRVAPAISFGMPPR